MKPFHLVFLLLFLCNFYLAQANPHPLDSTKVYSVAELEQVPEYKGGVEALAKFIRKSIVYPKEAAKAKEGGLVIVSVIIDKQGKVSNPQIIQSAVKTITATSRQDLNAEAVRVMLLTDGQWTPGKVHQQQVSSTYLMPIRFFPPKRGNK